MNTCFKGLGTKTFVCAVIALLIGSLIGCSQPAPTPTPTQAPKAAPPKDAAPTKAATSQAKDATPQAKEAKPQATAAPKAQSLFKINVPYAAISGVMAPLWVSKEKALFEKYGIDLETGYIQSSTTLTQAMVSGEVSLAETAAAAVVNAGLAGADVTMLASTANVLPFEMYARPEIKSIADLKGKAVGVGRYGASIDFAARYTLKKYGLEPDKDVAVMEMGGSPDILAGLQAGGIQAGVFGPPTTSQAKRLGMHRLINITDLGIPYTINVFGARKDFIAKNPEVVKSFVKAIVEGIAVIKKDKPFTMGVIGKYTKTEDRDVLDETYEFFLSGLLPRVPYVTPDSVQTILDEVARSNAKAKTVKPEAFIDNSIVKELDDSGFIKKLYGE
ncbi:MAG: ABC transporter substrate-binding protein [Chloroflexi bacterium]|nr:ABC transporter substrate-binding protein [Chloroflexota bacterium]